MDQSRSLPLTDRLTAALKDHAAAYLALRRCSL